MREPVPIDDAPAAPTRRGVLGRPSKLTPATRRRLLDALRCGSHYEPACRAAGISFQTFRNWLARGEREQSGQYFDFLEAVKKAEAAAELRALRLWNKAMPDDWRAAKDFLERRHSKRWNDRQQPESATFNLAVILQRTEERALRVRDPRPPIPGKPTIIDAIYGRGPYAIPPQTRERRESNAETLD